MVIIETPVFTRLVEKYLTSDDYRKLQEYLTLVPDAGDLIVGSGGLRKMRWVQKGRGKWGGVRVIYYWKTMQGQILMLYIYPKNLKDDLTQGELKMLRKIVEKDYL
jgi:mRNA-degrading endonuclease RelE of RelBE toxin-antitoxin system